MEDPGKMTLLETDGCWHRPSSNQRYTVRSAQSTALFLAASFSVLGGTQDALAYRPFDSTDAAVADLGELEVELGPIEFRRDDSGGTLIAPALVFNYGFAKNWEVVLEGRGEHPLPPAEDTRSMLVDDALSLKGVLREGVLQGKSGPSIATEFGVLLPEINGVTRAGASWAAIVSDRWFWGTMHFNVGVELTRDQHGDVFVGTIIEGPHDWTVRPVAEVRYEREFDVRETFSGLLGAIWQVRDNLAFDVGVREAWVNRRPETEIRAGLTFAFKVR
jgi:hypothetical protein